MFDPFPKEPMETEFAVPTTEEDLVYRADRYVEGQSPFVIYFPSRLLLFKLMRACIGVEHEKDLWFMPKWKGYLF